MMSKSKEDKFPLTYAVLKDLYHTQMGKQPHKVLFGLITERVPATEDQRNNNLLDACQQVNQPIWSLCEAILLGDYEYSVKGDRSYLLEVANQKFDVTRYYNMFTERRMTPDVTENTTEHTLLCEVLRQTERYETHDKYREELLSYYEEESNE